MKKPRQCGESTLKDFKLLWMGHRKSSVKGQLTPVEHNRLTVSDTVTIDEPAGWYMEKLDFRKSARGHLIALENKNAVECFLEETIKGMTMKQKAYGTLVSSEMHTELVDQMVNLPWREVLLRLFEKKMRTTPKWHALIAIPYVRTELQLRVAWCMTGLTLGEYDSEESKRSKDEKVLLMTSLRDHMICEGAAVVCAKRRDAFCFVRYKMKQMSLP